MLPAIGGYWLLTHWNFTKYRAERDSGYHLLLRSAGLGVGLFLLAYLSLSHLVDFMERVQPIITLGGRDPVIAIVTRATLLLESPPTPLSGEAVLSLFFGFAGPLALNLFSLPSVCARRTAKQFGDHVELLMEQALKDRTLVEVGLRNRRTYVGFVTESGVGKTLDADAKLIPRYSGRRDPNSLRLTLDTDYPSIMAQLQRRNRPVATDSEFVVPLSEIVSVRLFNREVYNAIFDVPEPPERPEVEEEYDVDEAVEVEISNYLLRLLRFTPFFLMVLGFALVLLARFIWRVVW